MCLLGYNIWDFVKIGGAMFRGPYTKDPTISGTILGSPIFGNLHLMTVSDIAPARWALEIEMKPRMNAS